DVPITAPTRPEGVAHSDAPVRRARNDEGSSARAKSANTTTRKPAMMKWTRIAATSSSTPAAHTPATPSADSSTTAAAATSNGSTRTLSKYPRAVTAKATDAAPAIPHTLAAQRGSPAARPSAQVANPSTTAQIAGSTNINRKGSTCVVHLSTAAIAGNPSRSGFAELAWNSNGDEPGIAFNPNAPASRALHR